MSQFGNYGGTGASDWWSGVVKGAGDFANRFAGAYGQAQLGRFGRASGGLNFGVGTVMNPEMNRPPSPADMPPTSSLSTSASAERARVAARQRTAAARTARQNQISGRGAPQSNGTGPSGPAAPSVSSLFAPLFQALEQQRKLAESRYAENAGQIQNIYGQLIGARKADITDIQTAYQRLQQAAASRGEATISGMQTRESGRLAQNEAVLESMGVGDIGTSAGDIASQSAAVAQDVERMNQSNWAGMLDAMGATSQDIARADMTSYGFAQAEDIAALQAARENYMQDVASQEFDLKFQQQQAQLQAQQAAAANAARVQAANIKAAQDAQRAQSRAMGSFERVADPLTRIITTGTDAGVLDPASAGRLINAYDAFLANMGEPPRGQTQWTASSAANAFAISPAAARLSTTEKRLVQQAIRESF